MTTIPQLPQTVVVNPTDQIMLDQSGTSAAATIALLHQNLQPKLTLAQGTLLGRVSAAPGQPEPVGVGPGLAMFSGSIAVDTTSIAPLMSPVFTGSPTAPTPPLADSSNTIATTAFVQDKYYLPVSLTGDVSGTGSSTIPVSLPMITNPGIFTKVNVNAKGQVTSGIASLAPSDMPGLAPVASSGNYNDLTNRPTPYILPAATAALLGGVKPGANLTVAIDGTVAVAPTGMDSSATTAIATGSTLARTLSSRFGTNINVLDYGADPTGSVDFAPLLQSIASAMPSQGGTIHFPKGTYRLNANVYMPDKALVELDAGVIFVGSGGFNTVADGSVLLQQQAAKTYMRVGSADSNAWTLHASQVMAPSAGTTSYEKAAIYAAVASYDQSTYNLGTSFDTATTFKDAVGIQSSGTILSGNSQGRAWGIATGATASSGADGALTGLEVDLSNNGAAQPENNRWNTKNGVIAVAFGPNAGTNAYVVNTSGGTWYDGYTVLKNAVTRNAFVLRDLSSYPSTTPAYIDASGNAQFRGLTATGGIADASYSVQTPATGFSITVPNAVLTLQLMPSGTLATGAITMPASPSNGQWLIVCSTATVTSCSFAANAGQSIIGAPSTLQASVEVTFQYQSSTSQWVCQSGNDSRVVGALQASNIPGASGVLLGGSGTAGTAAAVVVGNNLSLSGGRLSAVGSVSSVSASFTGGLISVGGTPVSSSGTLSFTVGGTSGGIPYFSSATAWATSNTLAANTLMIGGGAGAAPSTTATGTGILAALGIQLPAQAGLCWQPRRH